MTDEIRNIVSDRDLTPEANAEKPMIPKSDQRIRSASVEFFLSARAFERSLEDMLQVGSLCSAIKNSSVATPPPQPSPASGRGSPPFRWEEALATNLTRSTLRPASGCRAA